MILTIFILWETQFKVDQMVNRGNDSYTSVTLPNIELEKQDFVNYNGSGLGFYFVMEYMDLETYNIFEPYLGK